MADSISEMQSGRKIEGDLDDLIQHLQIREDEDQGIVLEEDLEELKAEARWTALAKMFPTKSPGPNGFPAHFFQHNWDICGDDLTRMVLRVLNGNETPTEINEGFSSVLKGESRRRC
ncbi:uncharacterized protein [Miscanthus floridulus]|uniref:uncharacterized protein isoform X2 n=1 Tax=Miscanthus floridulus TaxID=154761 RepID=UPI0034589607